MTRFIVQLLAPLVVVLPIMTRAAEREASFSVVNPVVRSSFISFISLYGTWDFATD